MLIPLIREMEHLRASSERGGVPVERLIAVANASLDVVIADPFFAELASIAAGGTIQLHATDVVA